MAQTWFLIVKDIWTINRNLEAHNKAQLRLENLHDQGSKFFGNIASKIKNLQKQPIVMHTKTLTKDVIEGSSN